MGHTQSDEEFAAGERFQTMRNAFEPIWKAVQSLSISNFTVGELTVLCGPYQYVDKIVEIASRHGIPTAAYVEAKRNL